MSEEEFKLIPDDTKSVYYIHFITPEWKKQYPKINGWTALYSMILFDKESIDAYEDFKKSSDYKYYTKIIEGTKLNWTNNWNYVVNLSTQYHNQMTALYQ
jgi:hypothetical protein